ncbi:hypothetical protein G3580_09415 [Nitrogeniibacter mangrovi]|uniref:Uncharacterized protein n=1 Tax=Nitrogeniibacter mangrovi TaxID=2016596 RepID=A0A6C1B6C5_9RHOO|nr:hypothetical protein [Nitrogeniibacter mangrovi]QID17840.1 hypothetical protein G3580_09415 [Nitrogeniibacter mangrovi]
MNSKISVPVPTELFIDLVDFLRSQGDTSDPVHVVTNAIHYWIDNASWKPELLRVSSARGYQWKTLFLPEGTEIRMQYKGAYSYAKVEGDDIHFEGEPISPAAMANKIAGSSRNAWRDLWIKRPADSEWRLADDCRADAIDPDSL